MNLKRIRDLRIDGDYTQEQLAKRLYITQTAYSAYERGKHQMPLDIFIKLSHLYGVSLDYLAGLSNMRERR